MLIRVREECGRRDYLRLTTMAALAFSFLPELANAKEAMVDFLLANGITDANCSVFSFDGPIVTDSFGVVNSGQRYIIIREKNVKGIGFRKYQFIPFDFVQNVVKITISQEYISLTKEQYYYVLKVSCRKECGYTELFNPPANLSEGAIPEWEEAVTELDICAKESLDEANSAASTLARKMKTNPRIIFEN